MYFCITSWIAARSTSWRSASGSRDCTGAHTKNRTSRVTTFCMVLLQRTRQAERQRYSRTVKSTSGLAVPPPIEPMLAKLADEVPAGDFLYEPKWDGFRAIVFRGDGDDVFIQSRDCKPLDRYFPELHELFARALPAGCVLDGEIVIASPDGLDFDALQMRLHPAA